MDELERIAVSDTSLLYIDSKDQPLSFEEMEEKIKGQIDSKIFQQKFEEEYGEGLLVRGRLSFQSVVELIDSFDHVYGVYIILLDVPQSTLEDISEDIARKYIDYHGIEYDPEDDCMHPFIRQSDAYNVLREDYEREEANDREFGTYEQQNRYP